MNGRLLFRIFYNTLYTLFIIALIALLLITPADGFKQALNNNQRYNAVIIAVCYFVTIVIALSLYAARIYTNRQVLAAIPKTWIPVEKGDVSKSVRKMIAAGLNRSAAIAWDARPRINQPPPVVVSAPDTRNAIARPEPVKKKESRWSRQIEEDDEIIVIPPEKPVWGEISHDGWSSPTSPDLPNLQYITVILELPHLIEAKAVSLAPPDQESPSNPPLPDIRAVDILQRPASMCLRDYISHLTNINVLSSPEIAISFLTLYENARFSSVPLAEPQFRNLMKQFADLLRSMQALSPAMLLSLDIPPPESDIDDDATSTSTPRSIPRSTRSLASIRSHISQQSKTSSEGTIRTRAHTHFSTAPATPRSRTTHRVVSRSRSGHSGDGENSFAQSRRPYEGSFGQGDSSSSSSLRSTSQTSVIKLSSTNGDGQLPYTLNIPGLRG